MAKKPEIVIIHDSNPASQVTQSGPYNMAQRNVLFTVGGERFRFHTRYTGDVSPAWSDRGTLHLIRDKEIYLSPTTHVCQRSRKSCSGMEPSDRDLTLHIDAAFSELLKVAVDLMEASR